VALLGAFALGLWGTVVRAPAFEIVATLVARPAPDLLLVRHDPIEPLGMGAMELMAVRGDPSLIDRTPLVAGDRVRLAVRRKDGELILLGVVKRLSGP
jgi:hypothetical protein